MVPRWSGNKRALDGVLQQTMTRSFEEVLLPHLDAAFNYARWLTKNDADAEDVVQDAYVRALRFFSSLRGEDARAWLLTIVRNTWYGRFPRRAGSGAMTVAGEDADNRADTSLDPEAQVIQQQTVEHVRRALETLPTDFREVLVLRELEGLSYKEIAAIVGIPLGTVMSRLARARERLAGVLATSEMSGGHRGLP
jgi:RNA polymerase sigma factor (sigma-70 family)